MENKSAIARYREKHDMTLEAFGALFGVDKSTASRWERGQSLTVKRAVQIEAVTGIPRAEVLFGAPKVEAVE
ncbi:helix-turn-helix transcriptional regulator [Sinorhizobium sp. 8-89]|uniref:helix-turn-helix domain-containing protein n=1 Tax=Sinorhizobium sp. 7-81 TaxID=3049087 RepID=UPI0024C358DA|nr:helix-turn-helix transcriptional regulator [Sinorhizobium sp. 7-81]MDK1386343.1 helix-turn-helix transcriptional regulator [Sinorhizobium sp. 7-81]